MNIDLIFGTTANTSWMQECARAALIFVYGLVVVRVLGRRVFGQWSALDIVVAIVTGSSLSRALTGNADLFGTLAACTLLMGMHWVLAQASARSRILSRLFEGGAVQIGTEGRLHAGAMRRHAVSETNLEEALRAAGVQGLAAARLIVLEPSGRITVVKQ